MNKIFCFGELLLRISPSNDWIDQQQFAVFVGGAELNVATALARWEVPVSYISALPQNYLSEDVTRHVAQKGIDVSRMLYGGERIGTYYLAQGADLKHAGVIYDRYYSSFYSLQPGTIDWDSLLEGAKWFHITAISPALNAAVAKVCEEGAKAASEKGITVSIDLNYRAKLWQYGQQPADIIPAIARYCDVIMGNIWAAERMLGITLEEMDGTKEGYLAQSRRSSAAIMQQYPRCKQVANTFRFDLPDGTLQYYATLYTNHELFVAPEKTTTFVTDRIGSGDCFMAGLIYGNHQGNSPQEIIDFAAAAAFNKLFVKGDYTTSTVEDIAQFDHTLLHSAV
jgi:2-dehydro-3-deoxygluconokinase